MGSEKALAASPIVRTLLERIRSIDHVVLLAVNRLPHTRRSNQLVGTLSDLGRGPGWVVICAWLFARDRRQRRVAVRTMVAMLFANWLAQGPLKRVFVRARPFHDVADHVVFGARTTDTSFPSGHAASSFAAATSLAVARPRWALAVMTLAAAVGVSRVYLGHHYPSDVVAGMGVGVLVGALAGPIS